MILPSAHATDQYATTTANLSARIGIHDYGTGTQTWWEFLGERLPRDGRVLEIGAGTGELWRRLPVPADLTVVDFSFAMCRRLRDVPGARVLRCDAGALPFADGSVDTLITATRR